VFALHGGRGVDYIIVRPKPELRLVQCWSVAEPWDAGDQIAGIDHTQVRFEPRERQFGIFPALKPEEQVGFSERHQVDLGKLFFEPFPFCVFQANNGSFSERPPPRVSVQ